MRIIIVGGGIAGTTCAEELRKLDPRAEITVISEEDQPLYSRPLLPHYLKGRVPRERVFLKTENWYPENNIEWLPGRRAEKVDIKNSFIQLSDGRELSFDKLVLAGGRTPHFLPEDRRGISYLWTLDDADRLLQLVSEQPRPSSVGVYGNGLIACEFVGIFKKFALDITVAFRGPHFWARTLDSESGKLITQHLEKNEVKVLPRRQFNEIIFSYKIFGVGIGLDPEIAWLNGSGLKINQGVLVNEKMETNLPGVYAIGDIAEVFDFHSGRNRIMGSWLAAQAQGRIAAHNIFLENQKFEQITVSAINLLGLDIIFLGDTSREWADEIKVEGGAVAGGVSQVFYKAGKVIGTTLVNKNSERDRILKMMENNP
jgi:NAD(P)H-nitrite reductase large subunit